jgi:transcriptional regulator with XRE-family HTH domain
MTEPPRVITKVLLKADLLREKREALKLTQRDVELAADLNRGQLTQYERSEARAPLEAVPKIARKLGLSPRDLLSDKAATELRVMIARGQEILNGSTLT